MLLNVFVLLIEPILDLDSVSSSIDTQDISSTVLGSEIETFRN